MTAYHVENIAIGSINTSVQMQAAKSNPEIKANNEESMGLVAHVNTLAVAPSSPLDTSSALTTEDSSSNLARTGAIEPSVTHQDENNSAGGDDGDLPPNNTSNTERVTEMPLLVQEHHSQFLVSNLHSYSNGSFILGRRIRRSRPEFRNNSFRDSLSTGSVAMNEVLNAEINSSNHGFNNEDLLNVSRVSSYRSLPDSFSCYTAKNYGLPELVSDPCRWKRQRVKKGASAEERRSKLGDTLLMLHELPATL